MLALLFTFQLNDIDWFISAISAFGAMYLAYLAYKIVKAPSVMDPTVDKSAASSLVTAAKINIQNPGPYIFWLTIGSSYILIGTGADATVFIICVIFSLCVTKFAVAVVVKKLGEHFNPRVYSIVLQSLAGPLLVFSV